MTEPPQPSPAPSSRRRLRHRKNAAGLLPRQATAVRAGYAAVAPIKDERGFAYHAGIHGLPLPIYCIHGQRTFLPWHQAYLYMVELALQDQVPDAFLPWRDWSSARSHREGIPGLFGRETLQDGTPNPLFSQPIPANITDGAAQSPRTRRAPQSPADLPTKDDVADVLAAGDYRDFNNRLENLHNWVHVWVGGTMDDVAYAAYDPLFWAHHAMVDRIWRLWQLQHIGIGSIEPALGYDYAVSTSSVEVQQAQRSA